MSKYRLGLFCSISIVLLAENSVHTHYRYVHDNTAILKFDRVEILRYVVMHDGVMLHVVTTHHLASNRERADIKPC